MNLLEALPHTAKRKFPDGTSCWCVNGFEEPHEGWVHAPACLAVRDYLADPTSESNKAVNDFADVIIEEIHVAHDVGIRPTGEALQAWTYICDHFEAFINRRRPDRRR